MFLLLDLLVWVPIAFIVGELFNRIKLPKLLGYLLFGIVLTNVYLVLPIDLVISEHVKLIAKVSLTVILLKAGLGISYKTLKKVGGRALLLGSFPNLVEGLLIMLMAILLLDFNINEAGMLGFAVSAVSPAVVIPSMTKIQDEGYGAKSGITTMNLASASIDDVFSLTLFMVFLNLETATGSVALVAIMEPISIINGIVAGLLIGYILARLFKPSVVKYIQHAQYLSLVFIIAGLFFMDAYDLWLSLTMAVMILGLTLSNLNNEVKGYLVGITNKIWKFAQVFLFFAIGTAVVFGADFSGSTLIFGVVIIIVGLIGRLLVSYLMLYKSNFTQKERLFNIFANIPKATIQATVAPLALAAEINGQHILTIAVLAIVLTAPIGLLLIESSYKKLLDGPVKT